MKKVNLVLILLAVGLLAACTKSSTSYATSLKEEKKLIEQYIERNHINIIFEEPDYMSWGENDYLEVADYCYFHLTIPGDTATEEVKAKDNINLRYRRYTLNPNADTLSYWNTNELPYPIEFQYGASTEVACAGWLYAVSKLKYTGAEGKLICPSKLGFSNESRAVTPYGYDLKIQIRRF